MSITFSLPATVEEGLRARIQNLDETAKEAALVELYRQAKLSHHELATALGISRFETDAVLKRHHVTEDLPTLEEFDEQMAALRKLMGE